MIARSPATEGVLRHRGESEREQKGDDSASACTPQSTTEAHHAAPHWVGACACAGAPLMPRAVIAGAITGKSFSKCPLITVSTEALDIAKPCVRRTGEQRQCAPVHGADGCRCRLFPALFGFSLFHTLLCVNPDLSSAPAGGTAHTGCWSYTAWNNVCLDHRHFFGVLETTCTACMSFSA